jgi:uncharacterized membrane protein YkvA (DUF1232 family)
MLVRILIAIGAALLVLWLALVVLVWFAGSDRGRVSEALRLLPDTVRLLRRIAADRSVRRGVRIRLWLLLAYLALPIDLVPDFVPVIGYADDVVIVAATLRSVVRGAGPDVVRRHWPGTTDGLSALWRLARLPGDP